MTCQTHGYRTINCPVCNRTINCPVCKAIEFFHTHAGFSYDPKTQTEDEGRLECAIALANAELTAENNGWTFHWEQSEDMTNQSLNRAFREWTDKGPEYFTWNCYCQDENGDTLSSLCGVDFSPDRDPWMDDYRRVVQAELALEAIDNK